MLNTAKIKLVLMLAVACTATNVSARNYEIPPTSITSSNVPWISDAAMEQCVKKYNEAKWLSEEIKKTNVNQYSQTSVDNYNSMITRQSKMTGDFNKNCAGKQSESAYKAAQKLNQKNIQ
jgi:hypothetical protein